MRVNNSVFRGDTLHAFGTKSILVLSRIELSVDWHKAIMSAEDSDILELLFGFLPLLQSWKLVGFDWRQICMI